MILDIHLSHPRMVSIHDDLSRLPAYITASPIPSFPPTVPHCLSIHSTTKMSPLQPGSRLQNKVAIVTGSSSPSIPTSSVQPATHHKLTTTLRTRRRLRLRRRNSQAIRRRRRKSNRGRHQRPSRGGRSGKQCIEHDVSENERHQL